MKEVKKKILDLSREQILKIYDQGPEAIVQLVLSMQDMINELAAKAADQEERIKRLEAIINKDSHNSSKPPSTDSPYKNKTKSMRKKGGKAGGQKGHKGTNLKLTDDPDEIDFHKCIGYCNCGHDLSIVDYIKHERRQVVDIPEIKIKVIEHRGEIKECPVCGKMHSAVFPEGVTQKAQYGNRLKSLSLFLRQYGFLSYERLQDTLEGLLGVKISTGTLVNFTNNCASRLEPIVDKIRNKLISSSILHCDESGHKISGKLNWLHVASNKLLTYYFSHPKRGKAAIDAMGVLPFFTGTAIHDHWKPYYEYDCNHSLCNAHHLRELIFILEEEETDWTKKLIECLCDAKREKEDNCELPINRIKYYKHRYGRILREGFKQNPENFTKNGKRGRLKQTKTFNLLRRLKEYKMDVLRFITDSEIPFDNNQAERDIRMIKVQQKISGGFRSLQGAKSFCIIMSYISSLKKCGQSVFEAFESLFSGDIILPNALERAE